MNKRRTIDVLSDSTGETAERVIRAALLQFPRGDVELRRHVRVRTRERVEPILRQVAADGALLLFSVVSPELSAFIHQKTAELRIEAIDVIGGVIGKLQRFLDEEPVQSPGAHIPLSAEYFRRIEAVEFTVRSDAGREPENLAKADVVLVGLPRTSKTPVAMVLAQRGLKVASLTLKAGKALPSEVDEVPAGRVVGLTIDVDSLTALRQAQLSKLGMPADARVRTHVEQEIRGAEAVFAKHPSWPIVDMTGRTVDETAGIVLEHVTAARPS
jgi:regulator of PEP synthase PpsR (kinase-PPPase family)